MVPNVPLISAAVFIKQMFAFKRLTVTGTIRAMGLKLFKRLTVHEYLWGYHDPILALEALAQGREDSIFGLLRTVSRAHKVRLLILAFIYISFSFCSAMEPAWIRCS